MTTKKSLLKDEQKIRMQILSGQISESQGKEKLRVLQENRMAEISQKVDNLLSESCHTQSGKEGSHKTGGKSAANAKNNKQVVLEMDDELEDDGMSDPVSDMGGDDMGMDDMGGDDMGMDEPMDDMGAPAPAGGSELASRLIQAISDVIHQEMGVDIDVEMGDDMGMDEPMDDMGGDEYGDDLGEPEEELMEKKGPKVGKVEHAHADHKLKNVGKSKLKESKRPAKKVSKEDELANRVAKRALQLIREAQKNKSRK